ncbi:SUMO1 sentrin specific peptidase 8 [Coemansia thaxteri]|nr:SUMO1 sentrin specific peptidase 8 [Coemansia thaxteri]KAJ2487411.1 SUMO1 sentrin specific peptidase 8 [Coemansia sp. RSA 2320]
MTHDAVLLDFENAEVRSSDFDSLRPEGWLTGEIINFYWTYLERLEFLTSPSVLFLGTYTAYRIANAETAAVTDSISTQLSEELGPRRHLILIPLNHRSHWSLLVYCRLTRTFYHYDSISKHNRVFAERAAGRFLRVLEPKLKDGFYFKSVHTPQQNNDYDCGVYVLAIAEELARRYVNHFTRKSSANSAGNRGRHATCGFPRESGSISTGTSTISSSSAVPGARALASDLLMPRFGTYSFSGFRSPFTSKPGSSGLLSSEPAVLRGGGGSGSGGGDGGRSREDRLKLESDMMERAGLPRDFWLVTVEDIEYPHCMRRRIRALVLDLQKQKRFLPTRRI